MHLSHCPNEPVMRKRVRTALFICCGLLPVLGAGLFALYLAWRQVPDFYLQAIDVDPVRQQRASDQMLQRATALYSDVEKGGRWEALFTAEQINGWLAVDLVENHPRALPRSLRDPRVAIDPQRMTLACRMRRGKTDSVVTLTVEPYLPEPNVLAVRICRARAGLLPLPLDGILDSIRETAGRADVHLRWQQADGDPVALISIPPTHGKEGKPVRIETLRLGKGEIYLAGTTGQRNR